jgi:hypothetical protein
LGRNPSVSRKLLTGLGSEVTIDLQRGGSEVQVKVMPLKRPGI